MLLLLWQYGVSKAKIAGTTILMPSKASGPYYTRKRFEKLQDELRAKEQAERLEAKKKRQLEIAEARAAIKARADAKIAELLKQANVAAGLPAGPIRAELAPDYSGLAQAHHNR